MKVVDFGGVAIFLFIVLLDLISLIFMIIMFDSPNMLASMLPPILWLQLPLNLVSLYVANVAYLSLCFVLISAYYFGLVFIPLFVREFKVGNRSRGMCSNNFRHPSNLTIEYRTVQILMQDINHFVGNLLLPAQTATTLMFVFSAYVVIRHRNELEKATFLMILIWAVAAPAIWSLVLTLGGYLHSHGQEILTSWKQHEWMSAHERKLMSKFRNSSKPIMICFGKLYVIRRVSLMIYVRSLSRSLVRALLALKTNEIS